MALLGATCLIISRLKPSFVVVNSNLLGQAARILLMIQTLRTSSMPFYFLILTLWLANKPKTFNKGALAALIKQPQHIVVAGINRAESPLY